MPDVVTHEIGSVTVRAFHMPEKLGGERFVLFAQFGAEPALGEKCAQCGQDHTQFKHIFRLGIGGPQICGDCFTAYLALCLQALPDLIFDSGVSKPQKRPQKISA